MLKRVLIAAALATLAAAGSAQAAGDPVRGKKLYVQCALCHGMQGQGNTAGPPLKGIIGKPAAKADFNYSAAMKASGLTWNEAALAAYLAAPQAKVKGTRMTFAGMKKQADIDDVIAYLKTFK